MAAELYIDGGRFEDTAGFYRQVTAQLARPGVAGGDNLDALCDLLGRLRRGGERPGRGALAKLRPQPRTFWARTLPPRVCRVLAGDAEEGFRTLILRSKVPAQSRA